MIKLYGARIWDPRRLGEAVDLMPPVLKKGDGGGMTYVEKVVSKPLVTDRGDQRGAEHPVPEPGGGVHVIGDEGKVIQPRPLDWCLVHMRSPRVCYLSVPLSNAARSQCASVAPASYV